MSTRIFHKTTKQDIIDLIKTYPKHPRLQEVLEELGWPHHRYQRIAQEVRKIDKTLLPPKQKSADLLKTLIAEALKEI